MTLPLALVPTNFSQVLRSHGLRDVNDFVERATIPEVKLKLDLRANIFGVVNGLGVFQDNLLKNSHLLIVPLPSSYAIKTH